MNRYVEYASLGITTTDGMDKTTGKVSVKYM